jgi:allophanate hydrolase subunit 1
MPPYKVLTASDTGLVVEFGDGVDRQLSAFVLALARRLNEARLEGITETVPTFRSLMVYNDPSPNRRDACGIFRSATIANLLPISAMSRPAPG